LDRLGHQRGGSGGDGAAMTLEAHLAHLAVGDPQVHRELVSAERIVAPGHVVRVRHGAEVPRLAVVVEDRFLVELAQTAEVRRRACMAVAHRACACLSLLHSTVPKSACAREIASASAVTSSGRLYSAKEARAVPGMPKRVMSGIAQWWPARMATPSLSRMVPRSCGWMPSTRKETIADLPAAVPTRRTPGSAPSASLASRSISCSCAAMRSSPTPVT